MFASRSSRISYQHKHRTYQSRLTKKERWKNLRTTVLMSILTAILLGGLVYWGLPLFIKLTSWWTGVQSKPSNTASDTIAPTIPRLLITNKATKEPKISLKGFGEPESNVYVLLNGVQVAQTQVQANSQFDINDITLNEGDNEISAYAKDQAGNESQVSLPEKIIFDNVGPVLEITSPQNNSVMRGSLAQTVTIEGTVNEEARIWINERLVIVDQGVFRNSYRLSQGSQDIVIKAVDQAGNETETTLTLSYQP